MTRDRVGAARWRLPVLLIVASLVASAAAVALASETRRIESTWRDRDVRVDGLDEEWRDVTRPVEGQHFAVGFMNDADALYFCLVSKDETTMRQIARMGLIVWLDHAGGKKQTFGVRYPADMASRAWNRRESRAGEEAPEEGAEGKTPVVLGPVAVLGPGRNDAREIDNGPSGVSASIRVHRDLLVYELRVPLRRGEAAPYAIDADPGAALRVGLQTPEWRGPVPLTRGPVVAMGGRRPGGGVLYPPVDTAMLKPLDVAADLRLASGPAK